MPYSPRSPIAGQRFRAACGHPAKLSPNDRKLMALLGAYADAGESEPPVKELARRLNSTPEAIDAALERLARRRLVWIDWSPYKLHGEATYPRARSRRNRYTCRFAGDPLPDSAHRVIHKEGAA
jgi:hypothetical protein